MLPSKMVECRTFRESHSCFGSNMHEVVPVFTLVDLALYRDLPNRIGIAPSTLP